jgi:hypothetical protein
VDLLRENVHASQADWDTRAVADGRYEVRVTSSDADANARREGPHRAARERPGPRSTTRPR